MCMKKILLFQVEIAGHALEYIKHLYSWAKLEKSNEYVFCIPKNKLTNALYNDTSHVNIQFLQVSENRHILSAKDKCLLLRNYIKQVNPTDVILLSFDQYLPYFNFLLPRDIHYSSFLYYLYIYNWKELNFRMKVRTWINNYLLFHNKSVKNILICNGTDEAALFNEKFKTSKFINIVDPIAIETPPAVVKKNIDKLTFLHMGALAKRKGTLDILNAISIIPSDKLSKMKFVFMGKISDNIKEHFYKVLEDVKEKADIVVRDEFCSFEEICQACSVANYLLMPYYDTSQSSGMLAYASAFNLPVVATNKGMIKKLVEKYKLGYLIDNGVESLAQFITNALCSVPCEISRTYIEKNSIANFISTFHRCFNDDDNIR